MKKLIKFLSAILVVFSLFCSTIVLAQSAPRFSIGLIAGAGTSKGNSLAIGGDLRYEFKIDKQFSLPISLGFTSITNKDKTTVSGYTYKNESFNYIPLKTGLKYSIKETRLGIYVLTEIGFLISSEIPVGAALDLIYSPALGYALKNGLDLAVKYEGISKGGGYAGIRLAYGFK